MARSKSGRRDVVPVPVETMEALLETVNCTGTPLDELVAAALWHYANLPIQARQAIADHFWLDRHGGSPFLDGSDVQGADGDGLE